MKPKTATLPQRVASVVARGEAPDDWQLLAQVVERYYFVNFERPPENTAEAVAVMRALPQIEEIRRARRTAEKRGLINQWREYYNSPTRVTENLRQAFNENRTSTINNQELDDERRAKEQDRQDNWLHEQEQRNLDRMAGEE